MDTIFTKTSAHVSNYSLFRIICKLRRIYSYILRVKMTTENDNTYEVVYGRKKSNYFKLVFALRSLDHTVLYYKEQI